MFILIINIVFYLTTFIFIGSLLAFLSLLINGLEILFRQVI